MSRLKPATKEVTIHETPLERFYFDGRGNFLVELDDVKERRLRITFLSAISVEVILEDCINLTGKGVPIGLERYILVKEESERIAHMATSYEKRNPGDSLMKRVRHYVMLAGDHWVEVIALGHVVEYV